MHALDQGTVMSRRIFVMTTPLHSPELLHSTKRRTSVLFQIMTGDIELIQKIPFYMTPFVAHDITFGSSVAFVQTTDVFVDLVSGSSFFP